MKVLDNPGLAIRDAFSKTTRDYERIIIDGRGMADLASPEALELIERASALGPLLAPADSLFLAWVGPRSRMAQYHDGVWTGFSTDRTGIVIGDKILPIDVTNIADWILGSLALKIRSYEPTTAYGSCSTGLRTYLGHTAFTNTRVVARTTVAEIMPLLHPLSRTRGSVPTKTASQ